MPALSASELTYFRREGHRSAFYASFLKPLTLWTARVSGSYSRRDQVIQWDTGTGSHWSAVENFQTVWIGSAPGEKDVHEGRVAWRISPDSGVTGTLTLDPNNDLISDNDYITFIHNYELWPFYPYIDPTTEEFFKNKTLAYSDQNEEPTPVCIVELSHRAGFIRNGKEVFFIDASNSYAMADGATISSYAASIYPTSGVTLTFNTGTGIGSIEVTSLTQEYYWLKVVVTDSNGKTERGYRCIFAHDPDPSGTTYPHVDFEVNQVNGAWDRGGWFAQVRMADNATESDIPDGTFCVLWREIAFGIDTDIAEKVFVPTTTLLIDPRLVYTAVRTSPTTSDVTVTFHAGVIVDGVPATDGTPVGVDLVANGGTPVNLNGTTTSGVMSLAHVFSGETLDGLLEAEHPTTQEVWVSRNYYGGRKEESVLNEYPATFYAFPQELIVGYVRRHNMQQSYVSGSGLNTIAITTIADLLRNYFMFSISLAARPSAPTVWNEYESWLTVGRAVHHIWKYHSTLYAVADLYGLTDVSDNRAYAEFEDGSLYTMPDTMARNHGIRAHVVCNKRGQIRLCQDVQLLTDAERTALPTVMTIDKNDRSGEMGFLANPEPRVALVYVSGLYFDGSSFSPDANGDDQPDVVPYCSTAPGLFPSQHGGEGSINLDRQVVLTQSHVDQLAGRVYAQANNEYPELRITFHGDYLSLLDFHLEEFWEIDIATGDTARGVALPDLHLIPRSVTCQINVGQGTMLVSASFEPEEEGVSGTDTQCMDDLPDQGGEEPPEIPTGGYYLPGSLVSGGSAYVLPEGLGNWLLKASDTFLDLVEDPLWRFRQGTDSPSWAILWGCGQGFIKRSENAGDTWTTVTPLADPPNDAGDSPAPTVANLDFISIQGSSIYQGEFYVVATWQNATSDWRSWIARTTDDGLTWTWETIIYGGTITEGSEVTLRTTTRSMIAAQTYRSPGAAPASHLQSIAKLSSTKVVSVYGTDAIVDTQAGIHARVLDISGSTITPGTETSLATIDTSLHWHTWGGMSVLGLDSSVFVILYQSGGAGQGAATVRLRSFTVSGTTITAQDSQALASGYAGCVCANFSLCNLSGRDFLMVYSYPPRDETTTFVRHGTSDGSGNLTLGTAVTLPAFPFSVDKVYSPAIIELTSSTFVLALYLEQSDQSGGLYAMTGSVSGSSVSFSGTWYPIHQFPVKSVSGVEVIAMDSTTLIYAWTSGGYTRSVQTYVRMATISGSTITTGDLIQFRDWGLDTGGGMPGVISGIDLALAKSGPNSFLLAQQRFQTDDELWLGRIDSGDILWARKSIYSDASKWNDAIQLSQGASSGKNLLVRVSTNPDNDVYSYVVDTTEVDTTEARMLGISASKIDASFYITYGDDINLYMAWIDAIDLEQLIVLDSLSLGAATFAEIAANTYIAWPLGLLDGYGLAYFFGRMNNPGGLGNPSHIVYYNNGTLSLVEGGLGTDYIGGMVEDFAGGVFAAENEASACKLYSGDELGVSLLSTSTLTNGIFMRGIDIDPADDTIILASNTGTAIMVVSAASPHTAWTNLTSDHPTAAAIKAIKVL